ncbi:MAG: hypothetical protein BA872_00040 [Desulfobacterales bacterium C00003060]|nr:MAG: hypothetical protein BA861_07340 [Desulfobacterales bacterium S3730MH5]OEU78241.1 MAG: hypothetical protein BA872_00040 [Desulfobacterales bacterium C00003060]OEU79625.1 MAG: hypothetical protein BA865_02780 [Desulfobacterales bacterium S5133MH4]
MFDLRAYLKAKQQRVNDALRRLWDNTEPHPTLLVQAMRYSLEAEGKRLRPILCIAASEAVGGSDTDVMPGACALEFIHTYSLIHDDLPALDDDDLRRGKPTCHKAFDEATAVLTGDALLTAAFEVLSAAGRHQGDDALKWLEVIYLIAKAAGHFGMIEGQMMDLASEGKRITLKELEAIHRLKTGALIEVSVRTGAMLGGGSHEQIDALAAYGRHIGLAFQVTDDILDIEGNIEDLGKSPGSDQVHQKATYPSLMGLDQSRAHARELIEKASEELRNFDTKAEPLIALSRYIIERKR